MPTSQFLQAGCRPTNSIKALKAHTDKLMKIKFTEVIESNNEFES